MFCSKCGNQVADGERFCGKCGNPMTDNVQPAVAPQPTVAPQPVVTNFAMPGQAPQAKPVNKNLLFGLIGGAVALFLIVVGVIAFVLLYKPTVKLDKYVTVTFNGYDSVGTATYSFDYVKFNEDWSGKLDVNKSELRKLFNEQYGDYYDKDSINQMVENYALNAASSFTAEISGALDKYNGLSNGDTILYTWYLDEETLETYYKCNIKYSEMEFEVEGLEAIQKFDPFTAIEVNFSGMSPKGSASINQSNYSNEFGYLWYSLDKNSGLKNGDTVTVKVELSTSEERYAESFGKLPYPTEKTFTVQGLASYITDPAGISEDLLNKMKSQSEDVIRSYVAKDWDDNVALTELSYLGNYFLSRKADSYDSDNRIYLVYRLTGQMTMETEQGTVVENADSYYYICFFNPMIDVDGSQTVDVTRYDTSYWQGFTVETAYEKPNSWWTSYYSFYYRGYQTLDKLYNDVVTKNLEYYSHVDNVTE